MSKYIDIGVNLNSKQFNSVQEVLDDAWNNYVDIIITGTNLKNSQNALKLVEKYKDYNLHSTVGIHPHDAKTGDDNTIMELEKLMINDRVVAIGECGLDLNRCFSPKDQQIKCFRQQLELAVKYNKPGFMHERDAFEDMYQILTEYKGKIRGVIHCFTGTKEQVKKYTDMGLSIGITTWVCDDRRNKNVLEALKHIPLDKLMVETDSPFLSPFKGQTNYPSNIYYAVDRIARELGKTHDEIAEICLKNTKQFFVFPMQ